MRFAKWVFTIAGIYGLVTVLPLYFLEGQMGEMMPPAFNHPEFYYGFIGVTVAWQLAFLIIGRDPGRYRLMMLPAIVEKFSFGLAVVALFAQGRAPQQMVFSGGIDLVWGVLFVAAFWMTREAESIER